MAMRKQIGVVTNLVGPVCTTCVRDRRRHSACSRDPPGTLPNVECRIQMQVSEAMTREVRVCKPQQSISECARVMDHRLVGILSLGEVALRSAETAADAVGELSKHGGPHSQSGQRPAHQFA
jgi:hypothetical protein